MPNEMIIHVGAPKCGSSSLQTALSRQTDFTGRNGETYRYACLRPTGSLLQGKMLKRMASGSRFLYVSSVNVIDEESAQTVLSRNAAAVAKMRADGAHVILSSEGWVQQASWFEKTDFIRKAGGNAHVVVYVRPGIEWLNSAWWQWGIWSGNDLNRFLKKNIPAIRWPKKLGDWQRIPGVTRVTVRLASSDTVAGFYELLDTDTPVFEDANAGVPPAFLHFLLRNRAYRQTAHDSSIEFVVGRHITKRREPAPWAIPPDTARETHGKFERMAHNLMSFLEPREQKLVQDNPRWWSAQAYDDRTIVPPEDYLTAESLTGLLQVLTSQFEPRQRRELPAAIAEIEAAAPDQLVEVADRHLRNYLDVLIKRDERQRLREGVLGHRV